jgi:hypothetical protein
MKKPDKLRATSPGKPDSELTKLKARWRDTMSEPAREFWRVLFISPTSQAEIRKQISAKLHVRLEDDSQLNRFRDWELEQRQMDLEAERAAEEERRLIEEHPDWTKDQVREDLLRRFYNRARATGDAKLGLKTIAADAKLESLGLDREKLAILKRKAEQADTATGILKNKKLTEDEKRQRMLELFGVGA